MRRFVALCLIGLFLAMPFVVAHDSVGPYNPIADVNKDGVVDIVDLVEVGQSYGSNYTLMHGANKTMVVVLEYVQDDSYAPVPNAIVGIVSAIGMQSFSCDVPWKSTNASGLVNFELSADSSYTAMAWDDTRSRYNYGNFTTDSQGEAIVTIWLNHLSSVSTDPYPIRAIPRGWTILYFLDDTTGQPYNAKAFIMTIHNMTISSYNFTSRQVTMNFQDVPHNVISYNGIVAFCFIGTPKQEYVAPCKDIFLCAGGFFLDTYRTDEDGGAFVVFPDFSAP